MSSVKSIGQRDQISNKAQADESRTQPLTAWLSGKQ
jgi:hypothetical protein